MAGSKPLDMTADSVKNGNSESINTLVEKYKCSGQDAKIALDAAGGLADRASMFFEKSALTLKGVFQSRKAGLFEGGFLLIVYPETGEIFYSSSFMDKEYKSQKINPQTDYEPFGITVNMRHNEAASKFGSSSSSLDIVIDYFSTTKLKAAAHAVKNGEWFAMEKELSSLLFKEYKEDVVVTLHGQIIPLIAFLKSRLASIPQSDQTPKSEDASVSEDIIDESNIDVSFQKKMSSVAVEPSVDAIRGKIPRDIGIGDYVYVRFRSDSAIGMQISMALRKMKAEPYFKLVGKDRLESGDWLLSVALAQGVTGSMRVKNEVRIGVLREKEKVKIPMSMLLKDRWILLMLVLGFMVTLMFLAYLFV